MDMGGLPGGQQFMDWLIAELMEIRVVGEISDMLVDEQMYVNNPVDSQDKTNECVRTVLYPGDC